MQAAHADIAELYADHSAWLRDWLSRHTRCAHKAADLAQDTFCRLIERQQLKLHAHPRRYLATVAKRLLIDDVRRRNSERHFLEHFHDGRNRRGIPEQPPYASADERKRDRVTKVTACRA